MAVPSTCLVKLSRHGAPAVSEIAVLHSSFLCLLHAFLELKHVLLGVTPIIDPEDTIKAIRSPQSPRSSYQRPRSSQSRTRSSTIASIKQAASPIAKADRRGSAAAAEVSSSSESEDDDHARASTTKAKQPSAAKAICRQGMLVCLAVALYIIRTS